MPIWLIALPASITFLTRIPIGRSVYPDSVWRWITIWFPLVGLFLGFILIFCWFLTEDLSLWSRAIIVVAIGILLTGGFHEDGLADSADALGGAYNRTDVLKILKDSRIGTFGSLALICVVLLKISLIVDLADHAPVGIILSHSLSRCIPVIQLGIQPYARRDLMESKSRDVAHSGILQVIVALLWYLIILGFGIFLGKVGLFEAVVITLALIITASIFGVYIQRRVGGHTGDFLGAIQQLSEVTILTIICLF